MLKWKPGIPLLVIMSIAYMMWGGEIYSRDVFYGN
jgi:hypothetical protein